MPANQDGDNRSDISSGGLPDQDNGDNHKNAGENPEPGRKATTATAALSDDPLARQNGRSQRSDNSHGRHNVGHNPTIRGFRRIATWTRAILAVATFLTATATLWQLGVMRQQLKQMKISNTALLSSLEVSRDQVNTAKDANKIAQRALEASVGALFSVEFQLTSDPTAGNNVTGIFSAKNYGKTAAYDVSLTYNIVEYRDQRHLALDSLAKNKKVTQILPDVSLSADINSGLDGSLINYTPRSRGENIMANSFKGLFAISRLTYKNIWGQEQKSINCQPISTNVRTQCREIEALITD